MGEQLALGVDIGGSKVAAGLVTSAGRIVATARAPMDSRGSAEVAMQAVKAAVDGLGFLDRSHIVGIGIASPGPLDLRRGLVLNSPNLPCWRNFALRDAVAAAYGLPARLENDANAAGLAEAIWGAAAGCDSVLYVTIGTGIGTGVVIGQQVYSGRGAAAEGGHMSIRPDLPVRCGCGKRGCIEGLAAGPAIARRALERRQSLSAGAVPRWAAGAEITAKEVVAAWQQGDALASAVIDETLDLLAIWLGNIIDLLDPEMIVIGGGVGSGLIPAFPDLGARAARWSIHADAANIPIRAAKFGVEAGIAGSAALWFEERLTAAPIG